MMKTEKHPFEPFLPEGAKMLFLGSFPPQEHRWCMSFYYPNWINDFWRIMGLIFHADKNHFCIPGEKRFDEAAIRAFCQEEGLAFYDTACEVRRLKDNAADAFLEVVKPTDVAALLRQIPECRTLVTTGQKATEVIAETFGCEVPPVGGSTRLEIHDFQGGLAATGPTASENYFSGRDPKSQFPEAIANPTHTDTGSNAGPTQITFWRMPSTSRAYPLALEKKADAYRKLFEQTKSWNK